MKSILLGIVLAVVNFSSVTAYASCTCPDWDSECACPSDATKKSKPQQVDKQSTLEESTGKTVNN